MKNFSCMITWKEKTVKKQMVIRKQFAQNSIASWNNWKVSCVEAIYWWKLPFIGRCLQRKNYCKNNFVEEEGFINENLTGKSKAKRLKNMENKTKSWFLYDVIEKTINKTMSFRILINERHGSLRSPNFKNKEKKPVSYNLNINLSVKTVPWRSKLKKKAIQIILTKLIIRTNF